MGKALYDAKDIASDLSIPLPEAEKLLNELCSRMKQSGIYTIKDVVPKVYYKKQKKHGFIEDDSLNTVRIPVNEKRLLGIGEFCEYAGGIGAHVARKYAKEIGAEIKIGGRSLVDREKFDRWCDSGNMQD